MPKVNGVGISDATIFKQFVLKRAGGHMVGSAWAVARKTNARLVVLDMTAGPGVDPKGHPGSPLILAGHAGNVGAELWLVERDKGRLDQLTETMAARAAGIQPRFYNDQSFALASLPKDALGISYWDPNGYSEIDLELLRDHGHRHRRVDILMTRECLAGHRMRRAGLSAPRIQDYLDMTAKRRGYVVQYAKRGWWAMAFFSNWEKRPPGYPWAFVPMESEEGQRLLAQLGPG